MFRRFVTPFAVILALFVVVAVPAAAHVKVSSDNATKGGYATLTFRVPNEESDADTVGLKIQMPPDHPIASVSVQPKPGWTFKVTTKKLDTPLKTGHGSISEVVSEIDWTGGKIAPGEFDQFLIQAGPLPTDTDSLTFKAIQTYEDSAGKTSEVAWIETAQPGQPEPDHPAPVLPLADASTDGGASSASTANAAGSNGAGSNGAESSDAPTVTATSGNATAAKSSSSNTTLNVFAMAFGAAGLVVAIAALVLAIAARQKMTMLTRDDAGDPEP